MSADAIVPKVQHHKGTTGNMSIHICINHDVSDKVRTHLNHCILRKLILKKLY